VVGAVYASWERHCMWFCMTVNIWWCCYTGSTCSTAVLNNISVKILLFTIAVKVLLVIDSRR
jgi:hypothetical protein